MQLGGKQCRRCHREHFCVWWNWPSHYLLTVGECLNLRQPPTFLTTSRTRAQNSGMRLHLLPVTPTDDSWYQVVRELLGIAHPLDVMIFQLALRWYICFRVSFRSIFYWFSGNMTFDLTFSSRLLDLEGGAPFWPSVSMLLSVVSVVPVGRCHNYNVMRAKRNFIHWQSFKSSNVIGQNTLFAINI